MKKIVVSSVVHIPKEASISVVHKEVTVVGPRGTESRSFAKDRLEFDLAEDGRTLIVRSWMPNRHMKAMVGTAAAHIRNLVVGVTEGFKLTTVAVDRITYHNFYHIYQTISPNKKSVLLRGYQPFHLLGSADLPGRTEYFADSDDQSKHFLIGTNIEDVTCSAARITQISRKLEKKGDPTRLLAGVYRENLELIDEKHKREPGKRLWPNRECTL